MGISTKGKSSVAVTPGSPRCSPHDGSLFPPDHHRRLLLDRPSAPVETASHDQAAVDLVFDKGELVGLEPHFLTIWLLVHHSVAYNRRIWAC